MDFPAWLKQLGTELAAFLKWVLFACIIGLVVGAVGILFHISTEWAGAARTRYPLLLAAADRRPADRMAVSCQRPAKGPGHQFRAVGGTERPAHAAADRAVDFYQHRDHPSVGRLLRREGAALQIGGSISSKIGGALRLTIKTPAF